MSRDDELAALERLAAARRTQLAEHWPTAGQVSRHLVREPDDTSTALRWFREGRLLAVYLPDKGGSWRFPSWQFGEQGKPVQHLTDILRVLRGSGLFPTVDHEITGWAEVEWFEAGHVLLGGHSPSEKLTTSPHQVLEAAIAEFCPRS